MRRLFVCALLLLASCGGSLNQSNQPASDGQWLPDLPSPSLLARSVSADSVFLDGAEFDDALVPPQRVSQAGTSAAFAPQWFWGDPFEDIAYALYVFDGTGLTGAQAIRASWTPGNVPEVNDLYIALGNQDIGRWDWIFSEPNDLLPIAEIAPYLADGNEVLVVIALTGSNACTLEEVALGLLPIAHITTDPSPATGTIPFEVQFDASESFSPLYEITQYEWDFDGDGTYETDQGATATATHTFDAVGVVLVGLRVTDEDAQTDTAFVIVTANEPGTWETTTPDDTTGSGEYSKLLVVDGNPAICYYNRPASSLHYVRATQPDGSAWGTPITVDDSGNAGRYPSMLLVNGNPAICYIGEGNLRYVRAGDVQGSTWGAPVTVDASGSLGSPTSMAIVNGNPAIAYKRGVNQAYTRAHDDTGSTWPALGTLVDEEGIIGNPCSLAVVDGNPAIAYGDFTNNLMKYSRATDADGTAWGAPIQVGSSDIYADDITLAVVDGLPSISFYWGYSAYLQYIRAEDATGSSWGAPLTLDDSNGNPGHYASLALIGGKPAVAYRDILYGMRIVQAGDAAGGVWAEPQAVTPTAIGEHCSMAEVLGVPGICYYDENAETLKFTRFATP